MTTYENDIEEYSVLLNKGISSFNNMLAGYEMLSVTTEEDEDILPIIVDNFNSNLVSLGADELKVEVSGVELTREGMLDGIKKVWNAIKKVFLKIISKVKEFFIYVYNKIKEYLSREAELAKRLLGLKKKGEEYNTADLGDATIDTYSGEKINVNFKTDIFFTLLTAYGMGKTFNIPVYNKLLEHICYAEISKDVIKVDIKELNMDIDKDLSRYSEIANMNVKNYMYFGYKVPHFEASVIEILGIGQVLAKKESLTKYLKREIKMDLPLSTFSKQTTKVKKEKIHIEILTGDISNKPFEDLHKSLARANEDTGTLMKSVDKFIVDLGKPVKNNSTNKSRIDDRHYPLVKYDGTSNVKTIQNMLNHTVKAQIEYQQVVYNKTKQLEVLAQLVANIRVIQDRNR